MWRERRIPDTQKWNLASEWSSGETLDANGCPKTIVMSHRDDVQHLAGLHHRNKSERSSHWSSLECPIAGGCPIFCVGRLRQTFPASVKCSSWGFGHQPFCFGFRSVVKCITSEPKPLHTVKWIKVETSTSKCAVCRIK